jgi:hypothetical protein
MRLSLHCRIALVCGVAAIVGIAVWGEGAWARDSRLAPEGRGLLPKPAKMPSTLGGVPPAYPFRPDPSGGFSRTIFATDEDADFKVVIRDFSFPPDGRSHTITFPSAAIVHRLSGFGVVSVSNQQLVLTPRARTAVPASAPIKVTNSGNESVVIRALIVEAK